MKITPYDVGWMAGIMSAFIIVAGVALDVSKPIQFILMVFGAFILLAGERVAKGMKS